MKLSTISIKMFTAVAIAVALGGCGAGGGGGASDSQPQSASEPLASTTPERAGNPAVSEPNVPSPPSSTPPQSTPPKAAATPGGTQPAAPELSAPTAAVGGTAPAAAPPSAPASADPTAPTAPSAPVAPASIEHIVVVVEENHSYNQIVGNDKQAPYMNELIGKGALLTNSFGVAHPSQPNYLALFSGSTQGVTDDSCGKPFETVNLASELLQKHLTFVGYSEDLPKAGFTGCSSKGYARKHNPWVQFTNVPAELNQPLTAFPQNFSELPTVSFVIPNHQDDMHDGTVQQADTWLKDHLQPYVEWAKTNRSLLIVTWDEDDNSKQNHIPTIFAGPMVKSGKYAEKIDHYNVLRTIEDAFHIKPIGESAKAAPLTTLWAK
jgi:acid phosphatase